MAHVERLTPEQFLLTLLVRLAAIAVLATMLARFRRFRHILIFERRGWTDRLVFTLSIGVPLMAGVTSRVILKYDAADLTLEGALLAGLIAGPYTGALVGLMVAIPPLIAGEFIALPFAVGCGFAGGGLREACPKESIWKFSPFILMDLPKHVWHMIRKLEPNWQIILLLVPVALELLRLTLGVRFGADRLFFLSSPSPWMMTIVVLSTAIGLATPIKIWNSARIEHRLQEQEKLLLAAKIEALKSQINPHFLFNTLTSISSLIRSQPDTARTLIIKLSALLRRLLRSHQHFVTLREELESIDEYLDIEAIRFGPKLRVRKEIGPDTLGILGTEHDPAAVGRELHQTRVVAEGRPRLDYHPEPPPVGPRGHRGRGRRDGICAGPPRGAHVERDRTRQRPRASGRGVRNRLPAHAQQ